MRSLKMFETLLDDMFHAVLKWSLLVKGMSKTTNAFCHQQFGTKKNKRNNFLAQKKYLIV